MRAGYPLDSVPGGGTGVPPEDLPRSRERPSQSDQSLFGESQLSLAATNKYLALMNKSADGGRATNERSALEPSSSMRRSPRSPQRKRSTSILLRRLDHRRKRRCRRMKSLRRRAAGSCTGATRRDSYPSAEDESPNEPPPTDPTDPAPAPTDEYLSLDEPNRLDMKVRVRKLI